MPRLQDGKKYIPLLVVATTDFKRWLHALQNTSSCPTPCPHDWQNILLILITNHTGNIDSRLILFILLPCQFYQRSINTGSARPIKNIVSSGFCVLTSGNRDWLLKSAFWTFRSRFNRRMLRLVFRMPFWFQNRVFSTEDGWPLHATVHSTYHLPSTGFW